MLVLDVSLLELLDLQLEPIRIQYERKESEEREDDYDGECWPNHHPAQ